MTPLSIHYVCHFSYFFVSVLVPFYQVDGIIYSVQLRVEVLSM